MDEYKPSFGVCSNCIKAVQEHAEDKCLYEATRWHAARCADCGLYITIHDWYQWTDVFDERLFLRSSCWLTYLNGINEFSIADSEREALLHDRFRQLAARRQ